MSARRTHPSANRGTRCDFGPVFFELRDRAFWRPSCTFSTCTQEKPMKLNRVALSIALSSAAALSAAAQVPPPPPPGMPLAPAGQLVTHTSRVGTVVYGPQGELQAMVLRNGIAVSVPPDLGMRLQPAIAKGTRVQVSGSQQVINGQSSMVAQSVLANGQTFSTSQPGPSGVPGVAEDVPPPPPQPCGAIDPRGPRGRRGPGAPPPPNGLQPSPPAPALGTAAPPPSPPSGGDPPPPPPQNQE
jgi:hypothetical protein